MYFYKDTNGLYYIGSSIVPPGINTLEVYDNAYVSVVSSNKTKVLIYPTNVNTIKKKDGSTYNDLAELLGDVSGFFK